MSFSFSKIKSFYKKHEFIFKLIFIVVFALLLYFSIDFKNIFEKIISIKFYWAIAAFLAVLTSNVFGNLSWYKILKTLRNKIQFRNTIRAFWLGLLFNNVLPSSIGGDVIKGISIFKYVKSPLTITFSILVDRIVGFFILIWIGISSFLFIFGYYKLVSALTTFTVFVIFSLFFSKTKIYYFFYNVSHLLLKGKLRKIAYRLIVFARRIFKNRTQFALILLYMSGSQFLKIMLSYCLISGIMGTDLLSFPKEYIFFVVPVGGLLSLISITPGGAGSREYFYALIFRQMGNVHHSATKINYVEEIVVISIIAHFLVILASLPGLIFMIKRDKGKFKKKSTLSQQTP
jgi:glycosyltransferase 2 family protein